MIIAVHMKAPTTLLLKHKPLNTPYMQKNVTKVDEKFGGFANTSTKYGSCTDNGTTEKTSMQTKRHLNNT